MRCLFRVWRWIHRLHDWSAIVGVEGLDTANPHSTGAVAGEVAHDAQQPRPDGARRVESTERTKKPKHGVLGQFESVVAMAGEMEREMEGRPLA